MGRVDAFQTPIASMLLNVADNWSAKALENTKSTTDSYPRFPGCSTEKNRSYAGDPNKGVTNLRGAKFRRPAVSR